MKRERLATLDRAPWSPWGREYGETPDRYFWGTEPSSLARELVELTGPRARSIDLGSGEGRGLLAGAVDVIDLGSRTRVASIGVPRQPTGITILPVKE